MPGHEAEPIPSEVTMQTRYDQIQAGWSAHDREGDKIGDIEELGQDYLLVTKGLIFTKDLYIPQSTIHEIDAEQGQVWLDVAKSEVDDMGWDQPPTAGGAWTAGGGSAVMDADATSAATGQDVGYGDSTSSDTLRVPVHEEELRAERTTESAGEVRIDKNVVEEERTLDVPVTREEVQIRSVATDGSTAVGDDAFSGDTIRVPVTEERVDVSKEARVVEEIEISKRPVTETQRVSETVRREQVDIDDSSNAMSGSATTGTTSSVGSSGYDDDLGDRDRRDREGRGEVGAEAAGGGAVGAGAGGALGDRAEEEADDEPRR